ncbi:MAG: helix-turn-helix domain-containing protein [Saprospiraceae bacterium]|nr:helix-turn-helix domain-containing protein [Saprospiraceae bacterium]
MAKAQQQRIIFGLKVRQFRQERGWNFDELGKRTGISPSYLNEIEKGKKYPQEENLNRLAEALGLSPEFLASPELTKQYAPLGNLLQSNFLNELPLDLFGIEAQQVVEIIARAPDRVNAFISALLEIARNYALLNENFYFAALRAYQELHMNYFDDIEQAAEAFVHKHGLPENGGVSEQTLAGLLASEFRYKISENGLDAYPDLQSVRSVYNPKKRLLLLNSRLNERQRAFQLAKELGFNVLNLKQRPLASTLSRVRAFEEVLNNYRAAYFAVALLVNRHEFVHDLRRFFEQPAWDENTLQGLLAKYQVSPEVLFQRFNVLSRDFDLQKVFFLRFIHDVERDRFEIDKELHLNRRHQPHASGLDEHYCRRWLSIELLRDLGSSAADNSRPLIGVQRALFADTNEEYLCLGVAKPGYPTVGRNVGVTLGILLDERARAVIRFWDDPTIPKIVVNVTCERCGIADCAVRAAPPLALQKREARKRMEETIKKLTG